MYRLSSALIAFFLATNLSYAAGANTQNWECAIDLHQGDRGTLSLKRSGDKVTGAINVARNGNTFESEVSGNWVGNEINIKRLLDSNSNEPMSGIVVAIGTRKLNMGGRFSESYQGVWSADCDLVAGAQGIDKSSTSSADNSNTQPSTSSRISPSSPTKYDRIKFSAIASHPDGIESISFFLGNKKIHSCESVTCNFSNGPLPVGSYEWRVEAESKSGVKSSQRANFVVKTGQARGQCNISGQATGKAAELSTIYVVNLYGPDNERQLKESTDLGDGRYEFGNLPQGRYLLRVDTKADKGVLVTPSSTLVNCKTGGNMTQNFNFD